MYADGGIEIGVCGGHDSRQGSACGQTCDIHPRIDLVLSYESPGYPGNERWLATVALLVVRLKLVPAPGSIRCRSLLRIDDQEPSASARKFICPCGKIVGVLNASVKPCALWQGF
jgi:hypothetical protein